MAECKLYKEGRDVLDKETRGVNEGRRKLYVDEITVRTNKIVMRLMFI